MNSELQQLLRQAEECRRAGKRPEAIASYRQALARDPELTEAMEPLGELLLETGQVDAARDAMMALVARDRSKNPLLHDLGVVYTQLGDRDQARKMLLASLENDPALVHAHYALAQMTRYQSLDEHVRQMQALWADVSLPIEERSYLGLALAKACKDLGDTTAAGELLLEGNRLRRVCYPFNIREVQRWFQQIREFFTTDRMQALARAPLPADRGITPVFIVGMPRSGTTLTEQILASHPQVGGLGESSFFGDRVLSIATRLGLDFPAWMDAVNADALAELGQEYLAYAGARAPGKSVIVEKTPFNFHFLGLIKAALPQAQFIHTRRDPRDSGFSMYQRSFAAGEHRYAYNQLELAQFYRLYEQLMDHWRSCCQGFFIEQDYEQLVGDFEPGVRALLDFLGLDFHEDCLRFHENRRPVATASVNQVRQPLYTTSRGAWQPYRQSLFTLVQALALPGEQILSRNWENPEDSPALDSYARALKSDDLAEAVNLLLEACERDPLYLAAHRGLVPRLQRLGRPAEALHHAQVATEIQPGAAINHYLLATVLVDAGREVSAVAALRSALQLDGRYAAACGLLAFLLQKHGFAEEARRQAEAALELDEDDASALAAMGQLAAAEVDVAAARRYFLQAIHQPRVNAGLCVAAGDTLQSLSCFEAASRCFARALQLAPDHPSILNRLGIIAAAQGDTEKANRLYRQAIGQQPDLPVLYYNASYIRRFTEDDDYLATLRTLRAAEDNPAELNLYLDFSLARAFDNMGDTREAWRHLQAGNRARHEAMGISIEQDEARFANWRRLFSAEFCRGLPRVATPADAPRPIFIIGMPRSGTSLLEQVLGSHSQIHAGGELHYLPLLLQRQLRRSGLTEQDYFRQLDAAELALLAEDYLAAARALGEAPRITDKMPNNFFFLPLLRQAFPDAAIIHCQRSPMDTCFSMLQRHFGTGDVMHYSFDQAHLGAYYRLYHALMAHWRDLYPGSFLDLRYEDMVTETEAQVRRLLDYCGLEFEPACLEFYKSERTVFTASMDQVRQPIYAGSIGAWQRYREYLDPLRQALGDLAD